MQGEQSPTEYLLDIVNYGFSVLGELTTNVATTMVGSVGKEAGDHHITESTVSCGGLVFGGLGSYFCLVFWVLGIIAASPLRNTSTIFRKWVSYGGRQGERQKKVIIPPTKKEGASVVLRMFQFVMSDPLIPRKYAFVSFYVIGAAMSYFLFFVLEGYLQTQLTLKTGDDTFFLNRLQMLIVRFLVLGLLGIHCLRRLLETMFMQRFRSLDTDRLSVFAAVSGASFYVFTPLAFYQAAASFVHDISTTTSSTTTTAVHHPHFYWLDQQTFEHPEVPRSLKLLVVNLLFQVVQWWHHKVLANQRPKGWKEPPKDDPLGVVYHLPIGRGFFSIVQEPHYLMEIFIYFTFCSSLCLDQFEHELRLGGLIHAMCFTFYGCDRLCMWLVVVFTFMNLRTTAAEKRKYWEEKRRLQIENFGRTDVALPRWIILPPFV